MKLQLRPDHQGAILEYVDAAGAGKAGLALEGFEIQPGRTLRVGTVAELFKEKAEIKSDKIGQGKKKRDAPLQAAVPIRRPNQPGARRGGRGGLGVKRGGVGLGGARATNDDAGKGALADADADGEESVAQGAKSNADFKAMFLKG